MLAIESPRYSVSNDTKIRILSYFTALLPLWLITVVLKKSVAVTSNITDVFGLIFSWNLSTLTSCNYFSPNEAP